MAYIILPGDVYVSTCTKSRPTLSVSQSQGILSTILRAFTADVYKLFVMLLTCPKSAESVAQRNMKSAKQITLLRKEPGIQLLIPFNSLDVTEDSLRNGELVNGETSVLVEKSSAEEDRHDWWRY